MLRVIALSLIDRFRRFVRRLRGVDGVPPPWPRPQGRHLQAPGHGGVSAPGLDHDGHPPTAVGGRAPQAPRLHRRRGRPALPCPARMVQGADAATSRCTAARRATATTLGRYAKDLPPTRADRWFYDHALFGLGYRRRHPRGRLRAADRPAGGVRPRQRVSRRFGRRQRRRPPLRPAPISQSGRQPAVAGVDHRR